MFLFGKGDVLIEKNVFNNDVNLRIRFALVQYFSVAGKATQNAEFSSNPLVLL